MPCELCLVSIRSFCQILALLKYHYHWGSQNSMFKICYLLGSQNLVKPKSCKKKNSMKGFSTAWPLWAFDKHMFGLRGTGFRLGHQWASSPHLKQTPSVMLQFWRPIISSLNHDPSLLILKVSPKYWLYLILIIN